ncbi:hypothetical protein BDE02_17G035700 [Populus trichocarpa]|nr:hypothetical protein BDE02_17G035700 [Populus trichocarpa]
MASLNCFILALFIAVSLSRGEAARHLLQLPPLPSVPRLPKPPLPSIPSLPQPALPTLPTTQQPSLPKPSLPPLPSMPTLPTVVPRPPCLHFQACQHCLLSSPRPPCLHFQACQHCLLSSPSSACLHFQACLQFPISLSQQQFPLFHSSPRHQLEISLISSLIMELSCQRYIF